MVAHHVKLKTELGGKGGKEKEKLRDLGCFFSRSQAGAWERGFKKMNVQHRTLNIERRIKNKPFKIRC